MRDGKRRVIVPANAVWDDFSRLPALNLPSATSYAVSRGLVLMTGNLGEFNRVDGLGCEDWEP